MPARYTPVVNRPDLVARAEEELGIGDARAWFFEGRWMVQGRNGDGRWRLFLAGKEWTEITSREEGGWMEEELENLVQGRLGL